MDRNGGGFADERCIAELETRLIELKKSLLMRGNSAPAPTALPPLHGDVSQRLKKTNVENALAHYLRYGGVRVWELTSNTCVVLFKVSVEGEAAAEYGLRLRKQDDASSWELQSYNLPLGFRLSCVTRKYEEMSREYFLAVHRALIAHHDRLRQINKLKESASDHILIVNRHDGSLIQLEISVIHPNRDGDQSLRLLIELQYEEFECRPDRIEVSTAGHADSKLMSDLRLQLEEFRRYPLAVAFQRCLMNRNNPFYCSDDPNIATNQRSMLRYNPGRRSLDPELDEDGHVGVSENLTESRALMPSRDSDVSRYSPVKPTKKRGRPKK